jgi:hypothetical protein
MNGVTRHLHHTPSWRPHEQLYFFSITSISNLSSNHTCDDQVFFHQRMHSAGRHDMEHLINGDKTLVTLLLVFLIALTPNYFICCCPKFFRFMSFWLPSCMIFCVCSYTNMCKMFRQESPDFNSVKTRCCLWVVFEQLCSLYVEMTVLSATASYISTQYGHC